MAISWNIIEQLRLPQTAGTFQPTLQVVASEPRNAAGQLVSLSDGRQVAICCISPELQRVELYDLVRLEQWQVEQTSGTWMLRIYVLYKVGHCEDVLGQPTMDVVPTTAAAQVLPPTGGMSSELQHFACTQPEPPAALAPALELVPTPMQRERVDNIYGRKFGEETYHVSVSPVALPGAVPGAGPPGAGPPPMAHAPVAQHQAGLEAASPARPAPRPGVPMSPGNATAPAAPWAAPVARPPASGNYLTVDAIASYERDNWRLLARVTLKGEKRCWKKESSEGTIFSVDLVDENGVETRAVFFNKEAEKFYPILEKGKLYSFSGGRKKKGNTKWCSFKIELTFGGSCHIEPLSDDDLRCPLPRFEAQQLKDVESAQDNATISVAGIVIQCESPSPVNCRNQSQRNRQNLQLVDDSNIACRVTLWGDKCLEEVQAGSIVLLKNVRVSEYNSSKSLNTGQNTDISVDQSALWHPRCQQLVQWYGQVGGAGASQNARSLSSMGGQTPLQTIQEMKDSAVTLQMPGATDGAAQQGFHLVTVTVTHIPHDKKPFYMACVAEVPDEKKGGSRSCNKKMDVQGDLWQCAAGHGGSPSARWICQFSACDHTGSQYFSSFDEVGAKLLQNHANEAARRWDRREVDPSMDGEIEQIFQKGLFKRFTLKVKSRKELYMDEEKLRYSALDIWPLDFVKDGRQKLLDMKDFLSA